MDFTISNQTKQLMEVVKEVNLLGDKIANVIELNNGNVDSALRHLNIVGGQLEELLVNRITDHLAGKGSEI